MRRAPCLLREFSYHNQKSSKVQPMFHGRPWPSQGQYLWRSWTKLAELTKQALLSSLINAYNFSTHRTIPYLIRLVHQLDILYKIKLWVPQPSILVAVAQNCFNDFPLVMISWPRRHWWQALPLQAAPWKTKWARCGGLEPNFVSWTARPLCGQEHETDVSLIVESDSQPSLAPPQRSLIGSTQPTHG